MELTKEQAKLLVDLAGQIQDQYGLIIGFNNLSVNPSAAAAMIREADFIIYEQPEQMSIHCFHKDDIKTQHVGPYTVSVVPSSPEHDEKVEKLFQRIEVDVLDGKIWFDPGVTRKVDDLEIEVTRKFYPGGVEVFDTNIYTERFGFVYTYDLIVEGAIHDKRFRVAKTIIDEMWPRPKAEQKTQSSSTSRWIQKILRNLGLG